MIKLKLRFFVANLLIGGYLVKKFKVNLITRLVIAIILGILIGKFMPLWFCRTVVTFSSFFSSFLKFVIPLMILSYVTIGIADLSEGAGKLLFTTVILVYGSTLICGSMSFLVAYNLFPSFLSYEIVDRIRQTSDLSVTAFFEHTIPPVLDTISSVVLAFILGLCLSTMKGREIGMSLYNSVKDLSGIINKILKVVIVPLLPLYICGTFVEMTYSGKTFAILSVLYKIFLVALIMQFIYLLVQFLIAGLISKKNPFILIKNQIPGYLTALSTQSSAATIPINLKCAEKNGICEEIRNFIVPLCANIHICGSMISITACATAVCLMYNIPVELKNVLPFIMVLGVAMIAAPGAPGGGIMTALPFLHMVFGKKFGDPNGPLCALMIALYITQDSFGTACNVSGDNAIGIIIDVFYKKLLNKKRS